MGIKQFFRTGTVLIACLAFNTCLHAQITIDDGIKLTATIGVEASPQDPNEIDFSFQGLVGSITVGPHIPFTVPITFDGAWSDSWDDALNWNGRYLAIVAAPIALEIITTGTKKGIIPIADVVIERWYDALYHGGPTEQTLSAPIAKFERQVKYLDGALQVESTLKATVSLKYAVTIPMGKTADMDKPSVVLERLSNSGVLIGNGTGLTIHQDFTNSGSATNIGGTVEGSFSNTGSMVIGSFSPLGSFSNTGSISVTRALIRSAPTTNDGVLRLIGGELQCTGGLIDNVGIKGYGSVPVSFTENASVNADVNEGTLTLGGFSSAITVSGGGPLQGTNGGNLTLLYATISGSPISMTGGGMLYLNNVTLNGGSITTNGGSAGLYFATLNESELNGAANDVFVTANSTFNKVNNHANIQVNSGVRIAGGSLNNNGVLTIGTGGASDPAIKLGFAADTDVTGLGQIVLSNGGFNGGIYQGDAFTVTLVQPIRGWGAIQTSLHATGTITSDVSERSITFEPAYGDLTINGGVSISGIRGGGLVFRNTNVLGGSITIDGGGVLSIYAGEFVGTTISVHSGNISIGSALISQSTINGGADTIFNMDGSFDRVTNNAAVQVTRSLGIVGGSLVNNNQIRVGNGPAAGQSITMNFVQDTILSGNGVIILQNGVLSGAQITQESGHTIMGEGTISARLINNGVIESGLGIGTVTWSNDIALQANSVIRFELGGTAQGVEHDFFNAKGSLTLGGSLNVIVLASFQGNLLPSDSFRIIQSSNGVSGAFSNVANGGRLQTNFGSCLVTVDSTGVTLSDFRGGQTWKRKYFSDEELLNLSISGDSADPNQNGIANLLEYAMNLDPRGMSNTGGAPSPPREGMFA